MDRTILGLPAQPRLAPKVDPDGGAAGSGPGPLSTGPTAPSAAVLVAAPGAAVANPVGGASPSGRLDQVGTPARVSASGVGVDPVAFTMPPALVASARPFAAGGGLDGNGDGPGRERAELPDLPPLGLAARPVRPGPSAVDPAASPVDLGAAAVLAAVPVPAPPSELPAGPVAVAEDLVEGSPSESEPRPRARRGPIGLVVYGSAALIVGVSTPSLISVFRTRQADGRRGRGGNGRRTEGP
jgi:hypothetical protein